MNTVIDTNVALSGLLWGGPPNQILKWARDRKVRVVACSRTMDELQRGLQYGRFSDRLSVLRVTPQKVMAYFSGIVALVLDPGSIATLIEKDPFDNLFLALALHHHAALIISGDRHLLDIESVEGIQIVTPAEAVQVISRLQQKPFFTD